MRGGIRLTAGTERVQDPVWRTVQAATVVLVLALFLWSVRDGLNPFLLFLLLIAVLLPFRATPGHTLLVAMAGLLTGYWLLSTTGFVLAPFVLAMVLAYVMDPLVDRLVGMGVKRALAVGIVMLPVVGLLAILLAIGVPALGRQIAGLIEQTPVLLTRLADWLELVRGRLLNVGFLGDELLAELRALDATAIVEFLRERQELVGRRLWSGLLGLGRGIGSVFTVLGYLVLTPVLTFYLLRDYDRIVHRLGELIPTAHREAVVTGAREYDDLLSRYLRGQFTVAAIIGSITAIGLFVLGFPYALLLGVLVAIFGLVPYVGLILSLIPAVLIALVSGEVVASLLKVAVVYGLAQALEGMVISPRIVGGSVGLHPVWVVLALAIGGFFFGFVGLLIAVPAAVGIKLVLGRLIARYRESALYATGAPGP